MYNIEADQADDLWFFTRFGSPKTDQISRDGQVNLAYAHPPKEHHISVSGRAEIVQRPYPGEVVRAAADVVPGRQG